jgi:hypothetical protein
MIKLAANNRPAVLLLALLIAASMVSGLLLATAQAAPIEGLTAQTQKSDAAANTTATHSAALLIENRGRVPI